LEVQGSYVVSISLNPRPNSSEALRQFRKPVMKKDMRSFLGTTSYYRKFILHYAVYSWSLTKVTRKNAPAKIDWTVEMENDFEFLCNSLCDFCVLTIPLECDDFTDASGKRISGVLSVCRNGAELPVAFFSRQLKDRERNYCATELECLAVKVSFQHFEIYLHGKEFTVQTDHRALESLLTVSRAQCKVHQMGLVSTAVFYNLPPRSQESECRWIERTSMDDSTRRGRRISRGRGDVKSQS
jgi:hypothetical protein